MIRYGAILDRAQKIPFADRVAQSDKELRVGIRFGHVPEFCLRFRSKALGNICRRMHLQREFVFGGQPFDEQRKAGGIRHFSEDLLPVVSPKIVQGFSGEWSVAHDALGFWSINDFPCLAELATVRESLAQMRLETPA